jgi:hypothetical protein
MHLLVPFAAAAGESAPAALEGLRLPRLEQLLARLAPGARTDFDAPSLNLPHEHVLAASRGWQAADGTLPLAAWAAQADGLQVQAGQGWGLLTPTHWQVGSDQIVLLDPAQLHLDDGESRALWQALRGLFDGEGWSLHWAAPLRWYAAHDSLAALTTASLDRVIGQPIDLWLPDRQAARTLRRLQSEAQMLLHTHLLNAAREARGELAVNSFWLWGTGRMQALCPTAAEPLVDERLRGPWLAQDWAAWSEAWQALDSARLGELLARTERGEPVSLTLCGERAAQRFDSVHQPAWQRLMRRWRRVHSAQVLAPL